MVEIHRYISGDGQDIVGKWLAGLKDLRSRAKISIRIDRLASGNFGDYKSLGRGLYELRVDSGPGYRLYYAIEGRACVLLLCGGNKSKQSADIERARNYLNDYRGRTEQ